MNRFERYSKNTKKMAIVTFCAAGAFFLGQIGIQSGAKVWQDKAVARQNEIVMETDYDIFNEEYKNLEIGKITQDYDEGKISAEEFIEKTQKIEDYAVDYYMMNSPDVSDEIRQKYIKALESEEDAEKLDVAGGIVGLGASAALLTEAISFFVETRKFKKGYPEKERKER